MFANYRSESVKTKGRLFEEQNDVLPFENCYEKDRDRILYSHYFRKLANKAQTFLHYKGDYYRTRLTHSLEVAQITRSICKSMGLNSTLGEVIALAHDIGHPPFGHTGEDALADLTKDYEKFEHNANTIKILTKLDQSYINFPGLNLTWEVLDGLIKRKGHVKKDLAHPYILEYSKKHNIKLDTLPSLEAQIAARSDEIAYHMHDLDDCIRSNIVKIEQLFELSFYGEFFKQSYEKYKNNNIEIKYIALHAIKKITNCLILDIIENTKGVIEKKAISSIEQIQNENTFIASFSPVINDNIKQLQEFFITNMYNNYRILRITSRAHKMIKDIFNALLNKPEMLPSLWFDKFKNAEGDRDKVTVITDFISGMTDRYAIKEHGELIDNQTLQNFYYVE
ncbi:dNTP triphosphohydrolase [Anaplasmataceae bacterium AB001_6]|nr:dNTP triphosphohydrolase [Anaplasmataceae bacterium AB001_6]